MEMIAGGLGVAEVASGVWDTEELLGLQRLVERLVVRRATPSWAIWRLRWLCWCPAASALTGALNEDAKSASEITATRLSSLMAAMLTRVV